MYQKVHFLFVINILFTRKQKWCKNFFNNEMSRRDLVIHPSTFIFIEEKENKILICGEVQSTKWWFFRTLLKRLKKALVRHWMSIQLDFFYFPASNFNTSKIGANFCQVCDLSPCVYIVWSSIMPKNFEPSRKLIKEAVQCNKSKEGQWFFQYKQER